MEQHTTDCGVWEWVDSQRVASAVRPCTCGLRTKQAEEKATTLARYRALTPLGMTDYEFLRTLGIDPQDECE